MRVFAGEYVSLRNSHEVDREQLELNQALGQRQWKRAAEESFGTPTVKHELEGELEFRGRQAAQEAARL